MNDDDRDPSSQSDPLDAWLAQARWAEPTAMSTERLKQRWMDLARLRRRRSLQMALAMAASILVVSSLWVLVAPRQSQGPAIALNPFEQTVEAAPVRLPGREMTGLERTLVEARIRNEERSRKKLQAATREIRSDAAPERTREGADIRVSQLNRSGSSRVRSDTGVKGSIAADKAPSYPVRPFLERVADPSTRSASLAELDHLKSPPIEQLLTFLSDPRGDLRLAAALALGRIDGPVLTRRLISMIEQNQSRREAFIALASSRGREAQLYVRGAAASEQFAGVARSAVIASQSELQ
jgi:hypothetical protein